MTVIDNVLVRAGASTAEAYERALDRLEALRADLERPCPQPLVSPPDRGEVLPPEEVERIVSAEEYRAAVETAKEYIRAGDAFQIVLSQRFDLDLGCEPFDVYRVLRQVNPSPYMFFLRQVGVSVVGASPEPMVQLLDGRVVIRPIAGTRRRGATELEDRNLEAELVEHPKERAEHVMLLDLARNDIGRVVAFGSEHVDELMTVERYSHVMH
ncbi:MAG: chorismate-binding protein, partial [Acidimicrobiales bacterium]